MYSLTDSNFSFVFQQQELEKKKKSNSNLLDGDTQFTFAFRAPCALDAVKKSPWNKIGNDLAVCTSTCSFELGAKTFSVVSAIGT